MRKQFDLLALTEQCVDVETFKSIKINIAHKLLDHVNFDLSAFNKIQPTDYSNIALSIVKEYLLVGLKRDDFALKFLECLTGSVIANKPRSKIKPTAMNKVDLSNTDSKRVGKSDAVVNDKRPTYPVMHIPGKVPQASVRSIAKRTAELYLALPFPSRKYKYCAVDDCIRCNTLYKSVPLTKCNHADGKKCNDVGLYPHLARATWKQLHVSCERVRELKSCVRWYINPYTLSNTSTSMQVDADHTELVKDQETMDITPKVAEPTPGKSGRKKVTAVNKPSAVKRKAGKDKPEPRPKSLRASGKSDVPPPRTCKYCSMGVDYLKRGHDYYVTCFNKCRGWFDNARNYSDVRTIEGRQYVHLLHAASCTTLLE